MLKRYAGRGLRASDAPFSRTEGLKVTFTHFYEGFGLYVNGGGGQKFRVGLSFFGKISGVF